VVITTKQKFYQAEKVRGKCRPRNREKQTKEPGKADQGIGNPGSPKKQALETADRRGE